MPNLPSTMVSGLMVWAATYFIHSTLLLGGVWLWFRQREPASHAFREAIWKLAAVGGILTASLQLGLEIQSPLNTAFTTAWNHYFASAKDTRTLALGLSQVGDDRAHQRPENAVRHSSIREDLVDSEGVTEFVLVQPSPEELAAASLARSTVPSSPFSPGVTHSDSENTRISSAEAATGLQFQWNNWLTGILAAFCGAVVALSGWGLVRLLTEQWEFRRRLATCRLISDGMAHAILKELLQEAGVRRRVRLMLDEHDLEPGACGWFNWQIVLPARAVEELSKQELRGLLAHELAHLVRRDQWWLLLGRLLAVCFAWQPLNRIALREWQRASEYLCDAWAIQRRVPRLSLARCLTTVAEWRLVGLATVAGLGSGNSSNLSQRVERLVDDVPLVDPWQRYSRRHLLAAVGSLIAVGMVSLAPAATLLESGRNAPAIAGLQFPQLNQSSQSSIQLDVKSEDEPREDRSELLSTDLEDTPLDVLVTVNMLEAMRQQVAKDMLALTQELDAMQREFSRFPHAAPRPLWHVQVQRLRQRLLNIQRLQSAMLIPL